MTLLIKNAQLVSGELVNIYVKDGLIFNISKKLPIADQKIEAEGKIIMPGVIDPHVHFRVPGAEYKEDWTTASKAAVTGGITTVLDMPNNKPATTSQSALDQKRRLIDSKTYVNYELYIGATATNLEDLKSARNIAGIKIYLGSSTGDLLVTDYSMVEQIMRECDHLVLFHSEDERCLMQESQKLKQTIVEHHNQLRPEKCAVASTKKIIEIVRKTNKPAYICHVSTKDELDLIRSAKKEGLPVYLEVAPHHLFLNTENAGQLGNFAKVNPPIRGKESQQALLSALSDSIIDTIGTDHAPHTKEEKEQDYQSAPSGMPGVETVLPLLLNYYHQNKISLERIVELTAGNPAKIFNLEKKGRIVEGFRADLILVDLDLTKIVKNSTLYSKCGWSAFAGQNLTGWPIMTVVNGQIVMKDGVIF